MKLSQFKSMLRELIREEVQLAVRTEIKKLNEGRTPAKPSQATPRPSIQQQRTAPLVTLDEPFANIGGPLGDLLSETAQSMASGADEYVEQANPDFPRGSVGTDMFVKDYSQVLKKSYNFNA